MTVQLTSVNPKYSNIFNFVKKSDLVKGGSATFRNEGGPSFNLSIFQPLVSPSAKLSSLIFIHQKGQTYRFDRLKFIQIYANWKSKEWNVQEHKKTMLGTTSLFVLYWLCFRGKFNHLVKRLERICVTRANIIKGSCPFHISVPEHLTEAKNA